MALTLHGTVSDNTVALDRKTATPLIINGDMAIAQRGTSATVSNSGYFTVDRFLMNIQSTFNGISTMTQNLDSLTPPDYFTDYVGVKIDTGTSLSGNPFFNFRNQIEANDISHLKFGTSDARTITMSFWVRSTLTGDFSFALRNGAGNRSFVTTYNIASANTWEKKTITIAGDTTGTWTINNGVGITVSWGLGNSSGIYSSSTLNEWQSGSFTGATTGVDLVETTNAKWYITGVQLEIGTFDSNSIPDFQFEDRGTSLARCQRYFLIYGGNSSHERIAQGFMLNTGQARCEIIHPCTMRSTPSVSVSSVGDWAVEGTSTVTVTSVAADQSSPRVSSINFGCSSGPTAGQGIHIMGNNTSNARLKLESEL